MGPVLPAKNKKLTSSQKTLICFCNLWVTQNSDAADLSCQAPWLAFWPIVSIPHSPSGVEIIAPNTRIGWAQFLCLFNCPCLVTWHIHRCSASSWTFSSFAFPFGLADLFMQLCSCLSYDLPIRKSVINILFSINQGSLNQNRNHKISTGAKWNKINDQPKRVAGLGFFP